MDNNIDNNDNDLMTNEESNEHICEHFCEMFNEDDSSIICAIATRDDGLLSIAWHPHFNEGNVIEILELMLRDMKEKRKNIN